LSRIILLITIVAIVAGVYFFSFQLQKFLSSAGTSISKKIGTFSTSREYAVQRYVYLHRSSLIAKLYNWINEQLIAAGMKRVGVTPVGYMLFWGTISAITAIVIGIICNLNVFLYVVIFFILVAVFLVATRVFVAGKMEKREADVMDALDLIIPEIGSGVKNAIARYVDNFSPSLQQDFKIFLSNIQDRGMSFEDAMFILADSLGNIFKDFAQKAVFYEALGEEDMRGIFDDIVETNRQRRELRYNNNLEFGVLRLSFIISAGITIGYFIFLMATDWFSRYFFLTTTWGNILLVAIVLTIFGVLSYIATIKSRAI
jgi:hypothetical protein